MAPCGCATCRLPFADSALKAPTPRPIRAATASPAFRERGHSLRLRGGAVPWQTGGAQAPTTYKPALTREGSTGASGSLPST